MAKLSDVNRCLAAGLLGSLLLWITLGGFCASASAAEGRSLFARVTVLKAGESEGPFEATIGINIIHRSPWYPNLSVRFEDLPLGKPSAWVDLSDALDPTTDVATASLAIAGDGKPIGEGVSTVVELARTDDAKKPLAAIRLSHEDGGLRFVLPERETADAELPARFRSVPDVACAHLAVSERLAVSAEDRPKHFVAAVRNFGSGCSEAVDEIEARAVFNLGYNTAIAVPPALVDKIGVPYVSGGDYRPPTPQGESGEKAAREHYGKTRASLIKEYGSLDRLRFFAMSDEPGWSFPHATELVTWEPPVIERFHAYLREKAMTPVLLGREGWSDVAPIGMPTPEAPLAERRLWYHTVRFSDLEEARTYAVAARAVRAELGEEVLGFVNWNNPGIFHSDLRPWRDYAVYCSSDWFTFSRARGNTCLWLGPGVSEGGYGYQSTFRMWSMALNLLRSAADQGVGRFGAYVHHNFIPDERGYEVALSIMAVAGHGGSGYESYVWGPRYAFTEYMWSEKFGHYAPVADANRLIGRSEYLMVNAEAPKAEVALLWPITSQLYDLNMRGYWTYNRDYLVEMEHVWFALNHQNIPVAFVDETMVQQGELAKYRLLYVTGPNVERKTAETIAGWVSEGGHLWSSAAAARRDEYNESMDVLDVVLGVAARSVHKEPGDYSPKVGLRNMKPLGTIVMRDAPVLGKDPWQAYGSRERFTVAPGAVVAGTFDDDGSAAVVRNEYGKGSSFHFAAMPGLAYSRGTTEVDGRPTIDYPEHIARLVAAPARALNVRRPARSSLRHVETAVLESEAGMAVTLLNWSGKPVKELEVTLRGIGGKVKRLSSARLGALPHETHGDHVVVTLSMPEVIDVMLIEFE